jgi:hypothetical protein
MKTELIRAFEVAVMFDRPTRTIMGWARRGILPGAVWIGNSKLWFHRQAIEAFLADGGTRQVESRVSGECFTVKRHGARAHAGAGHSGGSRSGGVTLAAEDSLTTKRDHPKADAVEHRWTNGRNVNDASHPYEPELRRSTALS